MQVRWQKSTYSGSTSNCVEVAHTKTGIRDSKNPDGPVITTSPAALDRFIKAIKDGQL
jgi:hypothetical protein